MELLAGVVANGYIVALNCIDWVKSRKLTSYDKIITSLAFSRFCLQVVVSSDNFLSKLYPDFFYMNETSSPYTVTWMFINQVSLCFASCLSVFYCVKIASVNQALFNWLKLRLSKLVPWLLLGSVLYCLVTTVAFTLFSYSYCISSHNSTDCLSRNVTISDNNTFLIHGIGSISPIILFIASSALLIISLWRHIRKMNLNSDLNPSFRNPTMDAHVRALKSVVSFFILYNIYYMALTLSIGSLAYVSDELRITVCTIIVAAYPSLHSIVLILGNPKLKLASARILHSANC
ncbi:taste receptor type 2 member 7-like [Terrapene carolina triunguis]|nr:taste receptor type 2 member 7-like [Terrapene carolina triunguis]